jgi:hypothetical protein
MITTRPEEVHSRIICVDNFVFWPIEDGIVDRKHGYNGNYLFDTLVPVNQNPEERV